MGDHKRTFFEILFPNINYLTVFCVMTRQRSYFLITRNSCDLLTS